MNFLPQTGSNESIKFKKDFNQKSKVENIFED